MTARKQYEKETGLVSVIWTPGNGDEPTMGYVEWLESSLAKLQAENERLKREFAEYRQESLGINSPEPPEH